MTDAAKAPLIFLGFVAVIIMLGVMLGVLVVNLQDFITLIKHGTNMPPNYELVTNGKQYKWKSPTDNQFSFDYRSRCCVRWEAVAEAWRDYEDEIENQERIKSDRWEKAQ